MTEASSSVRQVEAGGWLGARVRSWDRTTWIFGGVFAISVLFYVWIADTAGPLSLHDGSADRYNLLATAFLHLRLSVGPEPAILRHFENPLHPDYIGRALPYYHPTTDAASVNDDALYHRQLYFLWGPAPALVLLVPLHLLGFEPTAGVTILVFGVVGLGFALASLRLIIRQIDGKTPIWVCIIAGLGVSLSSVVPFLLRTPAVTIDTLAGGYCFSMAAIWLAISAISHQKASRTHLILLGLLIGLAANSRPTLWLIALIIIPVYFTLRSVQSRKSLLVCLVGPVAISLVLFMAYNQARFGEPFEIGSNYQVSVVETPRPQPNLNWVLPGLGFYTLTPPRFEVLFPFIRLLAPPVTPPPELTGGLLPYTPIVAFILALPWLWWRRRAVLGRLAAPLLVMAGVGMIIPTLPSYEFYVSNERYETDFTSLLVLGGLAAWLALSKEMSGIRRHLLRVIGGLLVAWGCVTGVAISFFGSTELAFTEPATWRALQDLGSPISTGIASLVGHPLIGEVHATNAGIGRTEPHEALSTSISYIFLTPTENAGFTIVAPHAGSATLIAGVELKSRGQYGIRVDGPGRTGASYQLSAGGGTLEAPITLSRGLNRLVLTPIATAAEKRTVKEPVMVLFHMSVASG
jgi:hypothetical protein